MVIVIFVGSRNFLFRNGQKNHRGQTQPTTHRHLGEELGDICNIVLKELIQNRHMSFLAEEYVVCQTLHNFCNDHQKKRRDKNNPHQNCLDIKEHRSPCSHTWRIKSAEESELFL